ncbi:helix-turn-helix domain-containing protein [Jiella sp. KSK16Y-1]|uniref:Helix-turn-helix domain-containing protein n=2 Tax=Jiella mangrovi TaxID=2821407 RepID=A0ABS4BLX3_9HYPH|nr:helix-turn-helix domain-containing protein [Jiella mangrovi]MBP0617680.1 helix-turn-helix domain-containing protein [Jiella mangrovi]
MTASAETGNGGSGYDGPTHPADDCAADEESACQAPSPIFTARAAIWREFHAGAISLSEAERRSREIGAGLDTVAAALSPVAGKAKGLAHPPAARPRALRPAPRASRQYANAIATTAMRDDRLTPGAKALLVVLRARCGKGRVTAAAKATLAATMHRSSRTIRRYLIDLERFGYIASRIRKTARGFHTGLVITLTDKVLPFFADHSGLAAWLSEAPERQTIPFEPFAATSRAGRSAALAPSHAALPGMTRATPPDRRLQGMTPLSSNNQFHQDSLLQDRFGRERPGGIWGKRSG